MLQLQKACGKGCSRHHPGLEMQQLPLQVQVGREVEVEGM